MGGRGANSGAKTAEKKTISAGEAYVNDLPEKMRLDYYPAIDSAMDYLEKEYDIHGTDDIYDRDDIYDSPYYPQNAELYNEFYTDEYGFDTADWYGYIARRIEERTKERAFVGDATLLAKIPKKHRDYIKDLYKEGNRYSAIIRFEDGFTRSIGEWSFSELKYEIKEIIERNRNAEF